MSTDHCENPCMLITMQTLQYTTPQKSLKTFRSPKEPGEFDFAVQKWRQSVSLGSLLCSKSLTVMIH